MTTTNEDGQQSDGPKRMLIEGPPPHYVCSFCGKDREEVEHMIAGPSVTLCNVILAGKENPVET